MAYKPKKIPTVEESNAAFMAENPQYGASAVTVPTAPTVPESPTQTPKSPFIAPTPDGQESIGRIYQGMDGNFYDESTGNRAAPPTLTPTDENEVRRSIMDIFQKEIDATNQIYAAQLAEAKAQGASRIGSTRAIAAARGSLGTDVGQAKLKKAEDANTEIEKGIRAEQQIKISNILGFAREEAADEIERKNKARLDGYEAYMANEKDKASRKAANLEKLGAAMVLQGINDISELGTDISTLAQQYGVSEGDIAATFAAAKNAKTIQDQKEIKDNSFNLSEGQSRYVYDPASKSYRLVASKAKTTAGGAPASGAYASDLDAIIGATISSIPSKFGQETFANQIGRSRNDSDKINLIATQVLKGQPAEFKRDFANQAVGISNIDKALALLESGVKTGVLESAKQYTYNLAGKDFDPNLAKVSAYITSAIQPYRNSVTGAAWGQQEEAEYASLFGSTKYAPEELKLRLTTLKEILKNKSVTGLNSFVNPLGYYGNEFETGDYAPADDGDIENLRLQGYSDEQIQALLNS